MEITTLTINEIKMITKDFLKEVYNIDKMPVIALNGRLGKRTLGQYFYGGAKKGTIEIAKNLREVERAVGVVLHEAVHYALHITKKDFGDGELEFEKNLAKYNLPTNYGNTYFERKFGVSLKSFKGRYFVKDMIKHYAEMIKANRNPIVKEIAIAKVDKVQPTNNIKLEKTKISSLLHEYKMSVVPKNDPRYKFLTSIVDAIDNTKAKEKDVIIGIYKEFLNTFNKGELFVNIDTRMFAIARLIETKVG